MESDAERFTVNHLTKLWVSRWKEAEGIPWAKKVMIMMRKPTDTTGLSSWELMDSRTTVNEPARDDLGALHLSRSSTASSACETTNSGFRIYPWCMFWLCWTHSLWWDAFLNIDARRRILVLSQLNNAKICGLPMRGLILYEE